MREASGPTGLLDGKPASALLLEAGDPHTAWSMAAQAVGDSPRSRFLAYLADVEHRLDQCAGRAHAIATPSRSSRSTSTGDQLADDQVRELPDISQTELDLDDGIAWAAPVGVIMKILPAGEPPPTCAPHDPRHRATLAAPQLFLHALFRAASGQGSAIDARRQMRALAPQLLPLPPDAMTRRAACSASRRTPAPRPALAGLCQLLPDAQAVCSHGDARRWR